MRIRRHSASDFSTGKRSATVALLTSLQPTAFSLLPTAVFLLPIVDARGEPFLTEPGTLTDAVAAAVRAETGLDPELSTSGGTSDGRFIAPHGIDVVELGPLNATIHKVNEEVAVDDLLALERIYFSIAERLLL